MPHSPTILADQLNSKLIRLNRTRLRIDSLYSNSRISSSDVNEIYEGLFLKCCVHFENFIEELFYGLLVTRSKILTPNKIIPRIEINSHQIARELALGGNKKYKDWIPYDRTIDTAKKFFRGGRPFTDLTTAEKSDIYKSYLIRNLIAHKSKFSEEKFLQHVVGTAAIPNDEKNAASYLRGLFRVSPDQTRYELYNAKLRNIAYKLTRYKRL